MSESLSFHDLPEQLKSAVINPQVVFEQGWVTGLQDPDNQIAQSGIDLTVDKIAKVIGESVISKTDRILPSHMPVTPVKLLAERKSQTPIVMEEAWRLEPDYYLWEAFEHVRMPPDAMALIIHRSTLIRSGLNIVSAVWDPGFQGPIGTYVDVKRPVKLERGARVAQIVFFHSIAAKQYSGLYMNWKIGDQLKTTAQ